MPQYLDPDDSKIIPLPARGGLPRSVHVIDEQSVRAINAAIATGRPLLVRGEPGTGKSQLARAAAERLGRVFLSHAVDGRTETRDLLWTVDTVARLAEAQVMGALHGLAHEEREKRIRVQRFVRPGPLWWAFDWESAADVAGTKKPVPPDGWKPENGAVVLVDEIDKADAAVPNGLLDALGHGCFDVPDCDPVAMKRERRPLVLITTNEERALPDAFLRRCWVLHLALPEKDDALLETLIGRGRAHFPKCAASVLARAATLLAKDRAAIRAQGLAPPGLAEYVDLIGAVIAQRDKAADQIELLDLIAGFALHKHPPEPAP